MAEDHVEITGLNELPNYYLRRLIDITEVKDLPNLCRISKRIQNICLDHESVWKRSFEYYFPYLKNKDNLPWREVYLRVVESRVNIPVFCNRNYVGNFLGSKLVERFFAYTSHIPNFIENKCELPGEWVILYLDENNRYMGQSYLLDGKNARYERFFYTPILRSAAAQNFYPAPNPEKHLSVGLTNMLSKVPSKILITNDPGIYSTSVFILTVSSLILQDQRVRAVPFQMNVQGGGTVSSTLGRFVEASIQVIPTAVLDFESEKI